MRPPPLSLALAFLALLSLAACNTTRPDTARNSVAASDAAAPWSNDTTIGDIVAKRPATARVFDLVGIDYCCGGNVSLKDAATAKKLEIDHLLAALNAIGSSAANCRASSPPARPSHGCTALHTRS